jgi:hypothetical protein
LADELERTRVSPAPSPWSTTERPAGRGPDLLRLARRDRASARAQLRALTAAEQADACRELRPEVRCEFLMLLDRPEDVVPLLPEAELVQTIRATGMSEAAWLLELASDEQVVACFDLDCWKGQEVELERCEEWLDALIEAGRPTLVRALAQIDLELLLLALWRETRVRVVSREEDPPEGSFTPDGVVYFELREGRSGHRIQEIAHATFEQAPSLYWRLAYGMLYENPAESEEYALRWRSRRLNDLGFPDRDDAMLIYQPLAAGQVEDFGRQEHTFALTPSAALPRQLGGTQIAEALAELGAADAGNALGQVLAVANWLAVADGLRLSEVESIPAALARAVRGIDRGLRELVRQRGQRPSEVLRRTRALDLFRVGATLDPELRHRPD